jgi:hypothetical protein
MAVRYPVWYAADSNTAIAISNGDRTIDYALTSNVTAKGSVYLGTGKRYFEVSIGSGVLTNIRIGVLDQAHSNTTYPGGTTQSRTLDISTGITYSNGTTSAYTDAFTNGDVLQVAVDLDSGKIWFGKNGTWLVSGDPTAGLFPSLTGATGFSSNTTAADNWWTIAGGRSGTSGAMASLTINADPTDLVYSPPADFIAWGSSENDVRLDSSQLFAATIVEGDTAILAHASISNGKVRATRGVSSGKWYWEFHPITGSFSADYLGVAGSTYVAGDANNLGFRADEYALRASNGFRVNNNSETSYGNSFSQGNLIMVALDLDNGAIWFGENGTWHASASESEIEAGTTTNAAFTGLSGTFYPAASVAAQSTKRVRFNFGEQPFVYAPPDGFTPLYTDPHTPVELTADGTPAMRMAVSGFANVNPKTVAGSPAMRMAVSATADKLTNFVVSGNPAMAMTVSGTLGKIANMTAVGAPAMTMSVSGTLVVERGLIGSVAMAMSVSGTLEKTVTGSISARIGTLGASLSGYAGYSGSISALVGTVNAALSGQQAFTGSLSARVGTIGAALSGYSQITGAISALIARLGAQLFGDSDTDLTFLPISMNLKHKGVTDYSGYAFNSLMEWNGSYYGSNDNGVYRLSGSDDAGGAINAYFVSATLDHETGLQKRISDGYVSGQFDDKMTVSIITDENVQYDYELPATAVFDAVKTEFGRGLKARYYQYRVANRNGADFKFDNADIVATAVQRRKR